MFVTWCSVHLCNPWLRSKNFNNNCVSCRWKETILMQEVSSVMWTNNFTQQFEASHSCACKDWEITTIFFISYLDSLAYQLCEILKPVTKQLEDSNSMRAVWKPWMEDLNCRHSANNYLHLLCCKCILSSINWHHANDSKFSRVPIQCTTWETVAERLDLPECKMA